ncbi:hypothetical protein HK098_000647 [Nowakowskiella sp. JEL0407]|nr:hypothetical protein HK098_000647 [Nowakowskiella sp. JEL0407]
MNLGKVGKVALRSVVSISNPVRQSSTATAASEVFFPSVLRLIHNNKIPSDVVSLIPRTGPKKRLLKGDVLAFLSDPSILGQTGISTELSDDWVPSVPAYYSIQVPASSLLSFASQKGLSYQDVLVQAVAASISEVPELSGKAPISTLTTYRLGSNGVSFASFNDLTKITPSLVSKSLKAGSVPLLSEGEFSIYDQTSSESKELSAILSPSQTGIIIFDAIIAPLNVSDLLFQTSTQTVNPPKPAVKAAPVDDLDFFATSPTFVGAENKNIDIELVVKKDVKSAVVEKFVNVLKKKLVNPASIVAVKK